MTRSNLLQSPVLPSMNNNTSCDPSILPPDLDPPGIVRRLIYKGRTAVMEYAFRTNSYYVANKLLFMMKSRTSCASHNANSALSYSDGFAFIEASVDDIFAICCRYQYFTRLSCLLSDCVYAVSHVYWRLSFIRAITPHVFV